MKANEFVKKFGVHIADHCLNDCASPDDRWFIYHGALIDGEDFDDLKRLVESHELVESKGGLIKAKEILADNPVWCSGSKRYSSPLERAIADVESCTEAGKRLEVKSDNGI